MFVLALAESVSIQLLPDGTMIFNMILIFGMIAILNRTFFKPINEIIETREKNKGGEFSDAKKILADAAEKRKEYNLALQDARNENYDLIDKVRAEALSAKQTKISEAKSEIEKSQKEQNLELSLQVEAAREEIKSQAEKMADQISTNLLKGA